MPKPQLIHIHGWNAFDSWEQYLDFLRTVPLDPFEKRKKWADWLEVQLGDKVKFISPKMPSKDSATYAAWSIWFERYFPYLENTKTILLGKSLGSLFLAKYLSENMFPCPISALHFVGCVFDGEWVHQEGIADFILDPAKLENLSKQVGEIHLWHSTDDLIAPWPNVEKYQKYLPNAILHKFENLGHFRMETFPEFLQEIEQELQG